MPPTVGLRELAVGDGEHAPLRVLVMYPSRAKEETLTFGRYSLEAAKDAEIEGARMPLVVLSHGTGSTPLTFRGLAAHLAREGAVVALPFHTGNHRDDDRLAHTFENLANRPRHVRAVIDGLFADPGIGPHLAPGQVAVVGHSLGAYTALAVAGGKPTCFPNETPDHVARAVPVEADARVRALVLFAPAAVWYLREGSLAEVEVPVLLRSGAEDHLAPPAVHAEIVERGLAHLASFDAARVPRAGHFSFQSPFPPAMTRPDFPPSQDPPGFDRASYQPVLAAEVTSFLRRALDFG